MRLSPHERDVTARIYADRRDESVPPDVRECWDAEQLRGWRSAQSAAHKVRGVKCGRRKVR
jgi:hypothetical protein